MNGGSYDYRTFTKIETIPSLKISKQTFIDSISMYLNSSGTSFGNGTIKLFFVVDSHSKIDNIQKISGDITDNAPLKAAVLKFSDFWLPGRQHNYIASSYVQLEMKFKNNILENVTISQ